MVRNEYQIVSQPGSAVDYTKEKLIQLIREGYGIYNKDAQETLLTSEESYEYRNADRVYFVLDKNEAEVGSLSVKIRPNINNDPFWQTLQSLLRQGIDSNLLACEIYGIIVHPQVRREGVASHLLSRMIEDLNPLVILGQTNVPEVVFLRTKATQFYGYRTFYGFFEVNPSPDSQRSFNGKPFIQASFIAQQAKPNEQGVYWIDPHILPPNVPDTKNFPLEIQKVFEPLIKEQQAIGSARTAVTTLVSIKDIVF